MYVQQPLPPGIYGGGAVKIDGKEIPVEFFWWHGSIDKRKLRRRLRRAAENGTCCL